MVPLARSFVDNTRGATIAQQAQRKRQAGLLQGSSAADGLLPEGAQGPLPSIEAQNAADLAAIVRANAAMPPRIRGYADAERRLDTIVASLDSFRRHYGNPVTIDSHFILFNARQRMFSGLRGWW